MRRLIAGLTVLWLSGAAAAAGAEPSSAVRHHPLAVPGLQAPAAILVDQWGVPHIQAASERDAFFLQGWNAARDRLWQIDLWRKRGLGLLAASFGPSYAEQDRAARLFLYRGDMAAEWAAYGPKAQGRAEAFVAGVNAYVGEVRAGRLPLPVEFKLTASQPDLWRPQDVVRIRSHALSRNVLSEVARAQVTCAAGLDADLLRHRLEPAWTTKIPDGLDPCVVPADVLADYELGTRDVEFAPPAKRAATIYSQALAALADRAAAEGSNNWVISAARTATGRPILANDPHRSLGVPSLRYIVHLKAPGLDVIGAGEPALPGVSVGHNETIAFGLTIFAIDQEDLYVYDLNPANPRQYRYNGGWEDMRVVHETIPVKGGSPREADLLFTRHGPVVKSDGKHAFAVRTVWAQPGTSAYFGSIEYDDAKDWPTFYADMSQWGAPSENMIFASTAGDIGWIGAGRAPIRPNWDGLLPVPGDGRYEWKGFLTADQLPSVHNPPEGWFASANEMNLPPGYPVAERKVGFEWADPTRITRIKQVLAANGHVSLADSMNLQMDDTSPEACRLKALLAPLSSSDADAALGLSLIKAWDCREGVGSAPTAVYEEWVVKHLPDAVIDAFAPKAPHLAGGTFDAIVSFLETPNAATAAQRQDVMLASLAKAVQAVRAKLGDDPASWRWGAMHHALFAPAAAALADPALAGQMTVGPLEVRGSASTPAAATWNAKLYTAISGASVRLDMDVGDWDNSVAVNTPGQSGDPYSPHYRDLFPLWAGGDYFPLAFSDAAVEAAARDVYDLTPAPGPGKGNGPMKLYQTYTSPFPTRVRLVLYAKGLNPEIIEPPGFHATVESKGDYFDINPIGRVPALVTDDGSALPESEVICEYLEDVYPEPPTLPKDPWGRAQVRLISRLCDFYLVMAMRPLFTASGQSRKRWDRAAIDQGLAAVETALGYIEAYIGEAGYAVGDKLTWADGALTPQLMLAYEWAPALFGSESPLGKHPKLAAYWTAIAKDPIAARLLKETRDAVAQEQANAKAIARSRA